MDFDLSAARRDFSDEKILQGLKSRGMLSFDVDAALKDGFAATEILDTIYKPPVEQPKPEPSSLLRRAGDVGISLARGVIGLPEALVGVADIPTLGLAGKGLQAARVDFKGAKDFLSEFYSPEQAAANKAVSDAKGFKGTIAASLENPSTILSAAAESLPQMLGGAAAARKIGATALGSGLSAITRGAAGEGIIAAGASAEGIRQQTEDGLLTPFQSGAAATSGALTGLIGVVGGRVANKLGIEDLDTLLAGSRKGVTTQGIAKRIIGGGISEGVFEELPQSAQEQIFQNAALDKPLLQGVEESAAKGLLVGAAMGGASNIRGSRTQTTPEAPPAPGEDAAAQEDASAETSPAPLLLENREDPLLSFPDGSVGRQSDFDAFIESLPENERIPQRARLMGLGEQASDPVPTVDDIIQSPDIDTAIESASAIIDRPTPAETEKKNSDVDMAWQEFNASKSAQREAEFAAAEQQRQIAQEQQIIDEVANQNVERANILTQAEGFDNPGQNAMQAAFERARQNRDTRPLSSITGGVAVSGFQVADLDASIRPLKMKWQGFSNVRTVQSVADIPPDIAARLNADAQTEGFYDPKTQSVYLIADAISTPERAAFVAAHEVIGHGGLRLLQDKTVTQAVQFASGNRFIKELAKAIGQERGSGQQNINTEEAIAELAAALETGDLTGIESRYGVKIPEASKKTLSGAVSRVIESVKRWFAGVMGIPIEQVSNREIYALISSQMAAVSGMSSSGTANPNYQGLIQQSRKEKGKSLSTEEIMELIDSGKDIFVRWSGGKKYDNKPSRDYVSGNTEAGLSAVKLENWDKTTLNSRLGEYVFQRLSDETRMPWIIEGKQNGVDSDGYPTIEVNSAKYLGFWNEKTGKPEGAPEFVKNQYGNLVRYMEMAEDLAENKLIMNRITNPIARQITQSAIDFQERALKFDPPSAKPMQSRAPKSVNKIEVDGVERSTVNSKGQPIAQTPEAMRNFWRWFGDSKAVDKQGRPLAMYHGTVNDVDSFQKGQADAIFVTLDPNYANQFATRGLGSDQSMWGQIMEEDDLRPNIMEVYAKADNPFDYENRENVDAFVKMRGDMFLEEIAITDDPKRNKLIEETYRDLAARIGNSVANGDWDYIERDDVQSAIRALGHDGFYVEENDLTGVITKNLAVFSSNQIKSATGNAGTFDPNRSSILQSRAPTTERIPKWAEGYSERDKETLRKAGAIYTEQTFKDKLAEMREGMGAKLVQGVLDQYAPIKSRLGDVPYMLARMSKASDQGLEAMMNYGRLFLDGGAIDVDTSKPGLVEVLAKLNGEHEQFFQWLAGNRAKQLKAQGRENLLSDSDITFLANLNQGRMKDGSSRAQAYATAQLQVAALNNSVLDIAEESGIIDKESRKTWASEFYVPFYRVIEEGVAGPTVKGGLINQQSIKRLKGGTNNLADLMGNMQKNWATLLAASAKNRAAASILPKAAVIGAATEVPESTARNMAKSASAKVASFMDEGVKRFYVMEDDALFTAISALEFNGYNNAAMRVMGGFKNLLTKLVTAAPGFKFFRNPVRDAISSIAVSNKLGWNPISNFKQGVTLLRDDDFRASMIAGGGMMRFGTYLDGNRADYLKGILNAKLDDQTMLNTPEKIKNFFGMLWDKYNAVGDYGENFNRAALYARSRKAGMSHLEASYEARDLMDFGLSGAWAGVRALNQVLPFFNARLQGLYKLGRGYNDDPKRVGAVIGTLALASIALLIAYKDDEDFKKRTDQDRNSNWWFKVGGVAYRIPKPFEVGAAATAIENFTALWLDSENTNAKRFAHQMGDVINAQLALNPIPQMVRPMIDVYANKDAFTGRPIESLAMQRLRPEDRYTYNTSEIARLIGSSKLLFDPVSFVSGTGYKVLSPVQIDSLIKGYFTSVGVLASAAVDGLLRSTVIDRGERLPVALRTKSFGIAEELPANSSRYIDILYDAAVKIDRSYASYKEAIKIGDIEKARDIAEANPNLEAKYHFISKVKDSESKLGAQIKLIMNNKQMTGEEKEDKIRRLKQRQNDIAQKVADKIK